MPHLILIRNPLSARDREVHELAANARPIDWLQEHYPNGFGTPIRFFLNSEEQELDDLDMELESDDVVVLAQMPALPLPVIVTQILVGVVLSAASMLIGMLFQKPQQPSFAAAGSSTASPVYTIKNQQNSARLGEPVPVVYGRVLMTPDYCSQPYTYYQFYPGEQYIDMLLVLSQGEVQVEDVLVGDTSVSSMDPGIVQYEVIPPSVHQGNMTRIGMFDFWEDVTTSPEVGNQQMDTMGDIGWFDLSKTGKKGSRIRFDIEFPNGLYEQDGQINKAATTYVWLYWQAVDIDGNPQGGVGFHSERFHDEQVTPVRRTIWIDTGLSAMWRVRVRRPANIPYSQHRSLWIWRGVKLYADITPAPVYGNCTLMAVRMRASKGIANDAQQKVRVLMTRILPSVHSGRGEATDSPADALLDIYTNKDYGARRPMDEVDLPKLRQLKEYWRGYGFNAVFTGKTTVWEAMVNALQSVAAAPLPLGSYLSVQQDGLKPVRSMLFSEANIVSGSFRMTYDFDPVGRTDSIEVEYRDPKTFSPAYAQWPTSGVDSDRVRLFGCTDHAQAQQYARLMWQRRLYQRKYVEFDTELEGLIPHLGERIGVSHTMPRWGQSGYVTDVRGLTLTLDQEPDWSAGPLVIMLRDQYGAASELIPVTPGTEKTDVVLGAVLPFPIITDQRQENTHYAIGTVDRVVHDFVLTDIKPKGGAVVTLTGVHYDPRSFDNTLPFLQRPLT